MCLVLRVSPYTCTYTYTLAYRRTWWLTCCARLHVRGWYTGMCANERQWKIARRRFTNICMGKKNHPSRSRPSEAGSGGRTIFWASFLYWRARHKIDERLWLIYYAEKNALKFIMIGVRLTIFFIASSTRTFLPIVPERGRRSDYEDYEWS